MIYRFIYSNDKVRQKLKKSHLTRNPILNQFIEIQHDLTHNFTITNDQTILEFHFNWLRTLNIAAAHLFGWTEWKTYRDIAVSHKTCSHISAFVCNNSATANPSLAYSSCSTLWCYYRVEAKHITGSVCFSGVQFPSVRPCWPLPVSSSL